MKITIDFYNKYRDDVTAATFELPDNTVITEHNWTKFGRKLKRFIDDGDEFCSFEHSCRDYYVFLPGIVDKSDEAKKLLKKIERRNVETMFLKNGMLMRFYSCDIRDFDKFSDLETLNAMVDLSDRYYKYVKHENLNHEQSERFKEIVFQPDKSESQMNAELAELEKETSKIVMMAKICRLDEGGLYAKNVSCESFFDKGRMIDSITHETVSLSTFYILGFWKTNARELLFGGIEMKPEFDRRIQEIINI